MAETIKKVPVPPEVPRTQQLLIQTAAQAGATTAEAIARGTDAGKHSPGGTDHNKTQS